MQWDINARSFPTFKNDPYFWAWLTFFLKDKWQYRLRNLFLNAITFSKYTYKTIKLGFDFVNNIFKLLTEHKYFKYSFIENRHSVDTQIYSSCGTPITIFCVLINKENSWAARCRINSTYTGSNERRWYLNISQIRLESVYRRSRWPYDMWLTCLLIIPHEMQI